MITIMERGMKKYECIYKFQYLKGDDQKYNTSRKRDNSQSENIS